MAIEADNHSPFKDGHAFDKQFLLSEILGIDLIVGTNGFYVVRVDLGSSATSTASSWLRISSAMPVRLVTAPTMLWVASSVSRVESSWITRVLVSLILSTLTLVIPLVLVPMTTSSASMTSVASLVTALTSLAASISATLTTITHLVAVSASVTEFATSFREEDTRLLHATAI